MRDGETKMAELVSSMMQLRILGGCRSKYDRYASSARDKRREPLSDGSPLRRRIACHGDGHSEK
jgi:hypothetical protein